MSVDDWQKRFAQGIDEFNRQEYFDCHETLEDCWREQPGVEREATQGIIQIAVAYYHLKRGNVKGGLKLFERGLPRVKKFAPICLGLDLANLVEQVEIDHKLLQLCPQNSPASLRFALIRAAEAAIEPLTPPIASDDSVI